MENLDKRVTCNKFAIYQRGAVVRLIYALSTIVTFSVAIIFANYEAITSY